MVWTAIGDLIERYADFPLGGTEASEGGSRTGAQTTPDQVIGRRGSLHLQHVQAAQVGVLADRLGTDMIGDARQAPLRRASIRFWSVLPAASEATGLAGYATWDPM